MAEGSEPGKAWLVGSKDDAVLLKRRADEFRAGYKNWRQFGVKGATAGAGTKGAKGEVTSITVTPGEGAAVGEEGFRDGYKNWRRGGHAGAVSKSTGIRPGDITRHRQPSFSSLVDLTTQDDAAAAASKGENWLKFFLDPHSEFHRRMGGQFESVALRAENLPRIAVNQQQAPERRGQPGSRLPVYARNPQSFGHMICHIGVGGFHRSHQAMYLDQLMGGKHYTGQRWGLVGIGLMEWDLKMRDVMVQQDCLYTLLTRSTKGSTSRVIGSIVKFVYAPDDRRAAVEQLAHPTTRIVSLTITEKGYCLDVNNKLDVTNRLIAHDLQEPDAPFSAVGTMAAALKLRRLRGLKAFTVLSCDNLPGNGTLSRRMLMGFLEALGDVALLEWCRANVSFPNTMVDRITPVTKDEHRELVKETLAIEDAWPVVAEDFTQWVVEDTFVNGRPQWDLVGALFVPDVHPYEMMKLRLLNAGHSALSYPAYLAGFRFVDAAMGNDFILQFIRNYFKEVTATVPKVPGVDMDAYKETLVQRFSNPYIKDTLLRLAEDGSMKLVTTMRDAALENVKAGEPVGLFCFVVASWIRFLVGFDENGESITIKDPRLDELQPMARAIFGLSNGTRAVTPPTEPPIAFIKTAFGAELAAQPPVTEGVLNMLRTVATTPMIDVLRSL